MEKIHISWKQVHKKNAQNFLANSAFFQNQSIATVFPSWPACLSVDLDKNISRMSLDSTDFSYSFFLKAEICKLKIFKNLPFAKISTGEIFKNFPFCKISTREIHAFSACKNKYTRKLVLTNFFDFFDKSLRMLLKPLTSAIWYTKGNKLLPRWKAELSKDIR